MSGSSAEEGRLLSVVMRRDRGNIYDKRDGGAQWAAKCERARSDGESGEDDGDADEKSQREEVGDNDDDADIVAMMRTMPARATRMVTRGDDDADDAVGDSA